MDLFSLINNLKKHFAQDDETSEETLVLFVCDKDENFSKIKVLRKFNIALNEVSRQEGFSFLNNFICLKHMLTAKKTSFVEDTCSSLTFSEDHEDALTTSPYLKLPFLLENKEVYLVLMLKVGLSLCEKDLMYFWNTLNIKELETVFNEG